MHADLALDSGGGGYDAVVDFVIVRLRLRGCQGLVALMLAGLDVQEQDVVIETQGGDGSAVDPSDSTKNETSSPRMNSSTTMVRPASPNPR